MTNAFETLMGLRNETKLVLDIILRNGPLTKAKLLDITKIKLSTLNRVMKPLEDESLIVETSIGESTGGRKPVLFGVNAKRLYFAGIDISRTYTRMIIADLSMNVIYQQQFPMIHSTTPWEVLHSITTFIQDAFNQLSINKEMMVGIGISAVGPMDRTNGILLNPRSFSAPGWNDIPIKSMVEEETGLPVIIDNGANMAVLAEYIFGQGKGFDNIAYINCGIGIRTGAISSGTIVRTINDAEDAFGHMVIDVDGELCSCGNYGCVECYSSILSIINKFTAELKKGRTSIIKKPLDQIGYIDICAAAENDDELAREIIMSSAATFGVGLANYINLLSPHVVILSGPLIKHSRVFYETGKDVALKRIYLKGERSVLFSRGGFFKENAMAFGAAAAVINHVLSVEE